MNVRGKAFFVAHRLIGSRLDTIYDEFLNVPNWSVERLEELSRNRLRRTLQLAASSIPFYRRSVYASNRELSLRDFPILTKQDLRDHFTDLMSPTIKSEFQGKHRKNRYSWIEVKTGGSTGAPTSVIHDRVFREYGRAARLFSNALCGFPIGTPYMMLWGSMKDINQMQASTPTRVQNWFLNFELMNAFRMDEARMRSYLRQINASSSHHMMAYVDSAFQLAAFAERENISVRQLKSIMACAGTVTKDARSKIEKVIQCRLHDKYGSRDCGDMACECAHGGFHIFTNYLLLEIVDDDGKPVREGESGRVLVTLLMNDGFPLIRYEIGDVGALTSERCSCGSPMPMLKRLEGRTYELILDTSGNVVTPIYFRHLLGVVHSRDDFSRFQFVQRGKKEYELLLESKATSRQSQKNVQPETIADLKKVLGADAEIHVTETENIGETASGKFLYTRNEYTKSNK